MPSFNVATSGGSCGIQSVHYLVDKEQQSITMEKLKKQVEALGLEEKQKTKFLMEEWKRLCEEKRLGAEREEKRLEAEREEKRLEEEREREEKRLEAEREREEKRLEAEREREEKRLKAEREHELELMRIELKQARLEFESKKGERENRSDVAEEIRRNVRIARLPELHAFVSGKDDMDNYLLRFERCTTVARWEKDSWATQLSPLLSGRALEVYLRLSQEDAMSYHRLKLALLKRYDFTEFGHRKRFREAKPESQKSPGQFMV